MSNLVFLSLFTIAGLENYSSLLYSPFTMNLYCYIVQARDLQVGVIGL